MRSTQLFALAVAVTALMTTTSTRAAVKISSKPTHNMNCSAGVCTPSAQKAVLNVNDLAAMLQGGDLRISSGSVAQDIEFDDAVGWASGHTLTLDAYHSIAFNSPLSVTGPGGLTITTNDGGSGGDFRFNDKGQAEFWDMSSSLIINGNSYVLVNTLGQLAADIKKNATARYALAANLDASIDGTYDEAPVTKIFGGTFEGLGNSISNLTIVSRRHRRTEDSMVGLFAEIYGGSVRDLAMINTAVDGGDGYSNIVLLVGTLAGINEGSVAFVRANDSAVSAGLDARVGGLVGRNVGNIANSSARGKVSGTQSITIGGLAGESQGSIETSSADVSVSGKFVDWAGGLVGVSDMIDRSYATGRYKRWLRRGTRGRGHDRLQLVRHGSRDIERQRLCRRIDRKVL